MELCRRILGGDAGRTGAHTIRRTRVGFRDERSDGAVASSDLHPDATGRLWGRHRQYRGRDRTGCHRVHTGTPNWKMKTVKSDNGSVDEYGRLTNGDWKTRISRRHRGNRFTRDQEWGTVDPDDQLIDQRSDLLGQACRSGIDARVPARYRER